MKKILFVDDEPWFHESLRYALELKKIECVIATDMTAALRLMEAHEFAAVITDIMMPPGQSYPNVDSQETGFHLIKIVGANWPKTRVVCLSVIGDQAKI